MATEECRDMPAYTPLTSEDIGRIVDAAKKNALAFICSTDLAAHVEIEEHEDIPGTFFVEYRAKSWRAAAAFQAAVIGAAWARGYYADAALEWEDDLTGWTDDGRRLVSVFITAADYMDETGHAAA